MAIGRTNSTIGETLPVYTGLLRFPTSPTISLDGSILTITAIDNATSYAIYSNNALLTTITTTSVDLSTLITTSGTYTIYVIAKGTGYADSEKSNSVSYVVASGYSVSCSQFETEAGYEYQYSTDNGSTWSNISNTGLIVSATQIKFRIHNMYPSGTPSATKKQIKSTLLGLNISITTESTEYVESENFTLTKNIDDIQCFSALPGYTVTVDTSSFYNGIAYYSTDDGESWDEIDANNNESYVLGEFRQIKFRITWDNSLVGIGCSIYSEILGLNLEPERNSTVESDNYVLTQDVDDIVINLN